jgi:hypothetical protein
MVKRGASSIDRGVKYENKAAALHKKKRGLRKP